MEHSCSRRLRLNPIAAHFIEDTVILTGFKVVFSILDFKSSINYLERHL